MADFKVSNAKVVENTYKLYSKANSNSSSDKIDYVNTRVLYGAKNNTFYPDPKSIFIPKSDLQKYTITFDAYGTFLFRNNDWAIDPPPSVVGPKLTFGVKFSTIDSVIGSITTTNVIPRSTLPFPNPQVGQWRYTLTVNPISSGPDGYICQFIATLMESGFDGVWSSKSLISGYGVSDVLANIQTAELSFVADGISFPREDINDIIIIGKNGHTVHRVG